ncbi:MAG: radical SAM protein, partial [Gammaproteobacteria bacterium]|nr:radical SAM protein [Gammaproteobacteria bacterium]
MCFYLKSPDNPPSAAPELSLDEIERITRSLGRLLWLAFSGGEVYLRKDLVEISKLFYDRNSPAVMLYPSNGLLPDLIRDQTEQIAKHCHSSVVVVKLSLDGVGSEHDKLRDTRGNFDKTMQTYKLLLGLLDANPNFELGFNTVLTA